MLIMSFYSKLKYTELLQQFKPKIQLSGNFIKQLSFLFNHFITDYTN